MKIYLLTFAAILVVFAGSQKCQQVGGSDLGTLAVCKVTSLPPQLQWSINVTLLQEYNWQGPDDVKYAYLTIEDKEINETCYPGQTMKGKYSKGTNLLIEHLCFDFSPKISKGDKLYLLVFSTQDSGSSQVVYMTFNGAGEWEHQEVTEEHKEKAVKYANKNLLVEE